MNSKTTISITQARKNIYKIAEDVQTSGRYWTLTENGKPKAVLISAEEFESWQETLEVMQNFPNIKQDISKVDKDTKTGAWKKYLTLSDIIKQSGYEVSSKVRKKSSKISH